MKQLVIVGGGFGGVRLARKLAKKNIFRITLVSEQDCFRYYPALYRTATGHGKQESCLSLQAMLSDVPNVDVVIKKIAKVDRAEKKLVAEDGSTILYDKVVFGLGVVTSHFGIPGIAENAFGIKTEPEVDKLLHHLHSSIEKNKQLDKNYVIVGAGATGIELSSALVPYLHKLAKKYELEDAKVNVRLVEAAPRILPRMSERAAQKALQRLEDLGVKVEVNKKVESQSKTALKVNGADLPTKTVIWTAGVVNNPFFAENKSQFTLGAHGKVVVNDRMQVDQDTYVIGDNAEMPYAGLALTAVRDAGYVADSLVAEQYGAEARAYKQKPPIAVVPIGKGWAIVEYKKLVFGGWIGGVLRYFADLVAYADVMAWAPAVKTWRKSRELQTNCPVCSSNIETV